MTSESLYTKYFQDGTRGFSVISRFYRKYADLLAKANLVDLNDVSHEVFASLAGTDFKRVQSEEHYVMRAIKLHCWSLLDRAVRYKRSVQDSSPSRPLDRESDDPKYEDEASEPHGPVQEVEGLELLGSINLFKVQLNEKEASILNSLIDGTSRKEIAQALNLNLNTVDTHIRRLRIRLVQHLKSLGYDYAAIRKFDS
jgi:RNA polymerase sigma factor (sigma-70 family)